MGSTNCKPSDLCGTGMWASRQCTDSSTCYECRYCVPVSECRTNWVPECLPNTDGMIAVAVPVTILLAILLCYGGVVFYRRLVKEQRQLVQDRRFEDATEKRRCSQLISVCMCLLMCGGALGCFLPAFTWHYSNYHGYPGIERFVGIMYGMAAVVLLLSCSWGGLVFKAGCYREEAADSAGWLFREDEPPPPQPVFQQPTPRHSQQLQPPHTVDLPPPQPLPLSDLGSPSSPQLLQSPEGQQQPDSRPEEAT